MAQGEKGVLDEIDQPDLEAQASASSGFSEESLEEEQLEIEDE